MMKNFPLIILIILLSACGENTKKKAPKPLATPKKVERKVAPKKKLLKTQPEVYLDDKNSIPFLFEYQQQNLPSKVKVSTRFGDFIIELYEDAPYHKANFIYLARLGYFDQTFFHRVVPEFIIQGGNSDHPNTAKKRRKIGRYLLPPDSNVKRKHHRGVVSIPSSEIDNPYKLASPYEFFIVQQSPGAYHLDGNYTPFGRVIEGMEVVDTINAQPIDDREAPLRNVLMRIEVLE